MASGNALIRLRIDKEGPSGQDLRPGIESFTRDGAGSP